MAGRRGFRTRIVTWSDYLPAALAAWAVDHGVAGISCEGFILRPRFAAAANHTGLGISVGVVNSIEQAEKVLPFGPEILVSDRPAELDPRDLRDQCPLTPATRWAATFSVSSSTPNLFGPNLPHFGRGTARIALRRLAERLFAERTRDIALDIWRP